MNAFEIWPPAPIVRGLRMAVLSHPLTFRTPAQTSRDVLTQKPTWYLVAEDVDGNIGVGECSLIPGLSLETESAAVEALNRVARSGTLDTMSVPAHCPAVRFAVEMAAWDLHNGGRGLIADSGFARGERGIDINGLVWMGPVQRMLAQFDDLAERGFTTLKCSRRPRLAPRIGHAKADARALPGGQVHVEGRCERSLQQRQFGRCEGAPRSLGCLGHPQHRTAPAPRRPRRPCHIVRRRHPAHRARRKPHWAGCTPSQTACVFGPCEAPACRAQTFLIGGLDSATVWSGRSNNEASLGGVTSALESNVGLAAIAQWAAVQPALNDPSPLPQGWAQGGCL